MATSKKKPAKKKAGKPVTDDELLALIESLPITPDYTPTQRYQDFRQLFTGSPQGKRVLREILAWGRMFRPSVNSSPVDGLAMAVRDGERNMAIKLLAAVNVEPPEQQAKATSKK